MNKPKGAVFASGTGSNFQAIMETPDLACDIELLVCDKSDVPVIQKAQHYGVPTFVFHPHAYDEKKDYEQEIARVLQRREVNWIFLAGYMRLIGPTLLEVYEGKMVNIHPSLLPAFPGKDAIGQAIQAKVQTTGVTVHYIDEGMDTGPIIAQESVAIEITDTEETLKARIQQVEHRLYPAVINKLIKNN